MAIAFQRIKLLTPLDRPIPGVRRLALRGDRVGVGGVGREGRDDLVALTPFDQPPQQEHRPLAARGLGDGLKRVDPLLRFGSIAVVDRRTGYRRLRVSHRQNVVNLYAAMPRVLNRCLIEPWTAS